MILNIILFTHRTCFSRRPHRRQTDRRPVGRPRAPGTSPAARDPGRAAAWPGVSCGVLCEAAVEYDDDDGETDAAYTPATTGDRHTRETVTSNHRWEGGRRLRRCLSAAVAAVTATRGANVDYRSVRRSRRWRRRGVRRAPEPAAAVQRTHVPGAPPSPPRLPRSVCEKRARPPGRSGV